MEKNLPTSGVIHQTNVDFLIDNGITPLNTIDIQTASDIIYPELYKKVVSIAVEDSLRSMPTFDEINDTEWINGLKNFISADLITGTNFTKTIAISDFNPTDPAINSITFGQDWTKKYAIKVSLTQMIQSFITPNGASSFVDHLVSLLLKSYKKHKQDAVYNFLTLQNYDGKTNDMVYDLIVDTTGLDENEVLQALSLQLGKYQTVSQNHLTLGFNYGSDSSKDFYLYWNNTFAPQVELNIQAQYFNYNEVQIKFAKIRKLDLTDYAPTLDTSVKFVLLDKDAIKLGQVVNASWNVNAPNASKIQELHMWYGIAKNPNFPAVAFIDVAVAAPFIKENNKRFKELQAKIAIESPEIAKAMKAPKVVKLVNKESK